MLHSSTARFSRRPFHFAMSVYFSAIKRDLAILTEWWQQRIAWWELLNAARQIICIRKQQHTWNKAYSAGQTVPSTAQIRAEGNNTKCVGKKRSNGSAYPRASERACVTFPPLILDKVRSWSKTNSCCNGVQHHFLRVRWLWMNRKMIGEAIYIRVSDRK